MKIKIRLLVALLFGLAIIAEAGTVEKEYSWPRVIEKKDAKIILYQPQIESLSANNMESRAAVSVTNDEFSSPVFGAMWFNCKISTDRDERIVYLEDVEVSAAKFPDVEEEKIEILIELLETELPKWQLELSLDQLLADLETNEIENSLSEGLNNAPPRIVFRTEATMLILIDGDPIFREIENTHYESVLNTPYFVVRDTKKDKYYIKGGNNWYVSENFDTWELTKKVPNKLEDIALEAMGEEEENEENEEEVEEEEEVIPAIIVRTTPTELLQSDGEPEYEPIEGTSILYMANTADDILMNIQTQEYYILIAGRWYKSALLAEGPWIYVEPEEIPEGFSTIPPESDMGSVLSSVAGTEEAKEALLENQIPQTAEVDRNEARLEITYDGDPIFEKVGDTNMKYAINTEKSVLQIDSRYYCCDNAIWFESDHPQGPWIVSTVVPDQVQEIPPESPVYNVKYVYIYDSTPDIVYVGYTPGYVNSYSYHGCVYYGTGYYYAPWYRVHYYPRPVTYGYSVHYNPYTGWGFSFGVSYGWMAYGWGAPHRGYWGPAGYRHGYHYGYHHGYRNGYRAGYYAGRRDAYRRPSTPYAQRPRPTNNVYNSRSQGVARTGGNQYNPRTGEQVASANRQTRPETRPSTRPNNVYTDRSGNVYQRNGDNWDRVDNSNSPNRPSTGNTQPSTRPSTGETRPSTGQSTRPSTGNTQPSTRPSTGETRPSTGQSTRPSTGNTQPSTRPSTGETRPSTGQSRPSTGNSYNRPGSSGSSGLNQDYNSRSRGQTRTQNYNSTRPSYQPNRPSSSGSYSRSSSPSRSSGAGSRRR